MDGVQLFQGYQTTKRRQFKFYHWALKSSWNSFEPTLEPQSGFKTGTNGLEIQCLKNPARWLRTQKKTVFYYHVTYAFHSESILYSCLNVNELLARNRHDIWSLIDSNRIRTHNHLVRKWTLNHLAKLAKWLSFEQGVPWHSGNYIV